MLKKISKIAFCLWGIFFLMSCTVVRHDQQGKKEDGGVTFYFESGDFNAADFVVKNWEARIVPEIRDNAVELGELLDMIRKDSAAASAEYGIRKEETSPYSFIVKGSYPVVSVDRSSAAGILTIGLDDLESKGECQLQIGPVIKKSAVRDALSFINFGDFANQIEFANISREINFYIRDHVVNELGESVPENSTADFYGVFILDGTGSVVITPAILSIQSGE